MTPTEIAKKLTPAQIRALRYPSGCDIVDFVSLDHDFPSLLCGTCVPSDLGRAVLVALDAKDAGNG